ncbi:iron ABC transporter ATP-binding protein [Pannonibacter phragmitetus]|uniref:ABC transporter ATP-binding protein n=1 Tax=Pannonibacter TaxID=227873 RepID=UPI00067BD8B4|nr:MULTISPECIES: ABC transporter ATP-binding protein [Pannonibacter]KND21146.1 iron ABC transporter ATP-binding protein [Pannonibacter phragmitetus]
MNDLTLQDITLFRGKHCVARDLSLKFEPGKVHVILGPNGAGKSSLLRALFGEFWPQTGRIAHGERQLTRETLRHWRKAIGYMPQDTALEASLTALEVVLLGRMDELSFHVDDATLHAAVTTMEAAGIAHLASHDILSLSGGQRQLALFAQVLLRDPGILLLDEPVSALDMHHQQKLLDIVHRETRARNRISILILHDLSLAAQYADQLILIGDGELKAAGSPAEVLKADLISRTYGVDVEILTDSAGAPVVRPLRSMPATLHP